MRTSVRSLITGTVLFVVLVLLTAPAMAAPNPFSTWGSWNGGEEKVQIGQAFDFTFKVFHPDSNVQIVSGEIVIYNPRTGRTIATVPIRGLDGAAWGYVTEWDGFITFPPNHFLWTCTIDKGYYYWWVRVRTSTGEINPYHTSGYMTVSAPRRK
jgi:hypothetical protein